MVGLVPEPRAQGAASGQVTANFSGLFLQVYGKPTNCLRPTKRSGQPGLLALQGFGEILLKPSVYKLRVSRRPFCPETPTSHPQDDFHGISTACFLALCSWILEFWLRAGLLVLLVGTETTLVATSYDSSNLRSRWPRSGSHSGSISQLLLPSRRPLGARLVPYGLAQGPLSL